MYSQKNGKLYELSKNALKEGDFFMAESYLQKMLHSNDSLSERNKIAIFNRLGIINSQLGRYKTALGFYKKAEKICIDNLDDYDSHLSLIYNNLAIVFKNKGDTEKALQYYNIALTRLNKSTLSLIGKNDETADLYLNLALVYITKKDYNHALEYLTRSQKIKTKYSFVGLEKVYQSMAWAYKGLGNFHQAEFCFLKSIEEWQKHKDNLHQIAPIYMDYALLLSENKQEEEAMVYFKKANQIYLQYFGNKHPYTAKSFLRLGDLYFQNNKLEDALKFYQKSIISNTVQFADSSLFSLPPLGDVIADIQFLHSLKSKAKVLFVGANQLDSKELKKGYLEVCINTIELSLEHISNIRRGYLAQSSKLDITRDEKKCYFLAIEASIMLYELTKEEKYKKQAYLYAQKSKASLLREEIVQNKAFSMILPDSLRQQKQEIESSIYSFKKLIYDENQKKSPNREKLDNWSHKLFKFNNLYEDLMTRIKSEYKQYDQLTSKVGVPNFKSLQQNLQNDQTIIEYVLSPYEKGQARSLFVFTVSSNELNYYKSSLNKDFISKVDFVRNQMNKKEGEVDDLKQFNLLNKELHSLYKTLVAPVEKYFSGTKIFIIPDEEIAYLSFDALQRNYTEKSMINYASVPYLIYEYCFSYSYASSLLFQDVPDKLKKEFVYAFAPDYKGDKLSNTRFQFGKLENTEKEINSILHWFNGQAMVGRQANEEFFKTISSQGGIFHFAMHASAEKSNPDFSFLAITQEDENEEDGFFYNYEIAMMKMNASLVVLSGCNTGDGAISSGEGVMSLTRNFILSGVPSIVHSLWEVQDETSVVIMDKFYEYLSNGIPKNEALRMAKLDYIKNVSPAMVNPYFWSGYVHTGNPVPVVGGPLITRYGLHVVLLVLLAGLAYLGIRRSKLKK